MTDWAQLEPYLLRLLEEPLDSVSLVEEWLRKYGELEAVISEEGAWRYIHMTRDTNSKEIRAQYEFFITEIVPNLTRMGNAILRKLYHAPGFAQLDPVRYAVLIRSTRNRIELFREENVPLATEIRRRSREFDGLASGLHIEEDGQKLTLQKAASLLELRDRAKRERVWDKITKARLAHRTQLDALMSDLIEMRTRTAQNAGFASYADFKFRELGRFDYTREACYAFHHAVEQVVKPELVRRSAERAAKLGLEKLGPWDLAVDEDGLPPLEPFKNTEELIAKVIRVFERLDPKLGNHIRTMQRLGHLDLDSRLGKAPGGYNYSLPETGVPFIFMNAVGTQSDLIIMLHETGHAIHSFSIRDLQIAEFKHLPAEISELASMSMELISLDFLDEFYGDAQHVLRARRDQILRPITLLPWIASIDAFQFWMYDHPTHTHEERAEKWAEIFKRFHGDYVSWEGYEDVLYSYWQKQGHIFDAPFYYIEYGIAQLGAIAVWRNYRKDPKQGLEDYLKALALGYSCTIPEVYAAAGVCFDFSENYIRELIDFLLAELDFVGDTPA